MVFIQKSKKTGTGKTKTPPYFNLLHSILSSKHKVKPLMKLLLKTQKPLITYKQEKEEMSSDDDVIKNIKEGGSSHFKKIKTSRSQHQEDMAMQQKLIEVFEKSVEEQKEQRLILNNAMLAIMETLKKQLTLKLQ